MLMDSLSLDRVLTAAVLASLAIAVAFGPELRRALARLRNRRIADDVRAPWASSPSSPSRALLPHLPSAGSPSRGADCYGTA
jgi:hypothetical protein